MALNKEIWLADIVENLYPDNGFVVKSVNDSAFVYNKTVHIPNSGSSSSVVKNRSTKPATVKQRTDADVEYSMDELTTDPIYIPNIDLVELSYDKRNSVIANDRAQLQTAAAQNILSRWGGGVSSSNILSTTGNSRAAHTSSTASGNRKSICKADVLSLMTAFDKDDVPQDGRYLLLDAHMYADLLNDLTEQDKWAFMASADAQKGVLGNLFGFNIMKRSKVLRLTAAKALLDWSETDVATELAAGFAWQESCVSHALGEVKMFDRQDDPSYYGDIYSFLLRTGGAARRADKKGVYMLAEVTATA